MLEISLYTLPAGAVCLGALFLIKRPALRHALAAVVALGCAAFLLWYFGAAYYRDNTAIATNVAVVLFSLFMFYALLAEVTGYVREKRKLRQPPIAEPVPAPADQFAVSAQGNSCESVAEFERWMAGYTERGETRGEIEPPETVNATAALETMLEMEAAEETAEAIKAEEAGEPALFAEPTEAVWWPDMETDSDIAVEPAMTEETPEVTETTIPAEIADENSAIAEAEQADGPEQESFLDAYNREMDGLRALVDNADYRAATDKVFEMLGAAYRQLLPEEELTRLEIVLRLLEERCK